MMRFFFYGTLCDPDILRLVLGYAPAPRQIRAARLEGYRRKTARGQAYPVLHATAGGIVDGLLFDAASAQDGKRLDQYEGPEYLTLDLPVRPLDGGAQVQARVYLPRPGCLPAGRLDWRLDTWQRQHKAAFIKRFLQ